MTQTLYFSVLLIALCSLSECIQRRYHHINMMMNWTEALRYCREKYTDLGTVNNINDMNQLMKSVDNSLLLSTYYVYVWIGLKRSSKDSWMWADESDSTFTHWRSGEPNNGEPESCTVTIVNKQGEWNDVKCYESYTFVCHEDKLILINESLSWSEALRYCRENHVDLVSVDSEEIQRWVTDVIHQSSTDAVWMGLRHSCAVGLWFWVNGEMVCYQNWAPGNETAVDDCDHEVKSGAVQSGDHRWITLPESQQLNFICIRK
ncbi:macrophage mannose receptor 1-like [Misgurnus anguillicaudatus]|uniref:macrophage mannose receptor 1-like n=1 Tax=Misgurnus anguillicaudatus TaxID=75329 RepID=UPI003CCFA734